MKENTVENAVDQSPTIHLNQPHRRKVGLRFLGVALLLSLALGSYAAVNYLVPRVPDHAQGTTRLSWYLHSGQSKADARTLAAAFRYVMGTESDTGTVEKISNPSVAQHAAPASPKS
jgi:hypothetical protein